VNAVAELELGGTPFECLARLRALEHAAGRPERRPRLAPRTLDLDLLLHGDTVLASDPLTLPHPSLHERAFVVVPLAEVAPGLVVPGHGAVSVLLRKVAGQRVAKLDR